MEDLKTAKLDAWKLGRLKSLDRNKEPLTLNASNMNATVFKGRLLYIIGRSGVGKDSVLNAIRPRLGNGIKIIRRYITREEDPDGENHYPLTDEDFNEMLEKGGFSLHWESHGLKYGIGKEMEEELMLGNTVIVNGSRDYLAKAADKFPQIEAIEIIADPDIVVKRLTERKRESQDALMERIEGGTKYYIKPRTINYHKIDNSGSLSDTVNQFWEIIVNNEFSKNSMK